MRTVDTDLNFAFRSRKWKALNNIYYFTYGCANFSQKEDILHMTAARSLGEQ